MPSERDLLAILSGQANGPKAMAVRAGLSVVEPFYASAMRLRNTLFNRGIKPSHDLGRPTVSVGNLTTGGTGKTPVVQWLAQRFIDAGRRPAVLLRGYRSKDGISDEAELYKQIDGLVVEANPDRVAGAASVLGRSPTVDTFLLDDAFQHRRAKRDFDLVLIDASNPFGHDHVLPRGLLREPATGLRRADAILITHANDREDAMLTKLRNLNPAAPIYQCRHVVRRLIDPAGRPVDANTLGTVAGVAGIGNPNAFFDEIESRFNLGLAQRITLPDHATFDSASIKQLNEQIRGVDTIVVTEKDWVKLSKHASGLKVIVARAVLELDFADGHDTSLFEQISGKISPRRHIGTEEERRR